MEKMVSVIIPVFNVENCVAKCIESVICQTYKNIEIIVIDDGSTDRSGDICDYYRGKDDRIIVIHKENGGLSEARNSGIDHSSGVWISFVDSDDWIEPEFIEKLVRGINSERTISMCYYYKDSYNKREKNVFCTNNEHILPNKKALRLLLEDEYPNFACNKLFPIVLFEEDKLRFPRKKAFEDVALMYKLVIKASNVSIVPEFLYHYVVRKDSITQLRRTENMLDLCEHKLERYHFVNQMYPEFKCCHWESIEDSYIRMAATYVKNIVLNKQGKQSREECKKRREYMSCDIKACDKNEFVEMSRMKRLIFRLCVKNNFMTDCFGILLELLRRILRR